MFNSSIPQSDGQKGQINGGESKKMPAGERWIRRSRFQVGADVRPWAMAGAASGPSARMSTSAAAGASADISHGVCVAGMLPGCVPTVSQSVCIPLSCDISACPRAARHCSWHKRQQRGTASRAYSSLALALPDDLREKRASCQPRCHCLLPGVLGTSTGAWHGSLLLPSTRLMQMRTSGWRCALSSTISLTGSSSRTVVGASVAWRSICSAAMR